MNTAAPAMPPVENAQTLCTLRVSFAGRPILLRTNAPGVARCVSDYLPVAHESGELPEPPAATITLMLRSAHEPHSEDAYCFRARGHFALARFTAADALWFNLRTREVFASFSTQFASDRERLRYQVFPALLGILSAVIDVAPVHAACIAHRAGGILLTGHSGAGKSTLAVSLGRRGYALLADEWTYLSGYAGSVEAWSIPTPVKLLPDARCFFPELSAHRADISLNGELAYEVNPENCFGISRQTHTGVSFIVLLERMESPGCRIVPISAMEAIDHIAKEIEPLEGSLAECYERQLDLVRQLDGAICFRASFNDHPAAVADAIDNLLLDMSRL
jgi:hypothetical protein